MKITEPIGIFQHFEQASPEAMRAQRQAELKAIADWRRRRLSAYQDWADPAKRDLMQAEFRILELEAIRLHAAAEKKREADVPADWKPVLADGESFSLPYTGKPMSERIGIIPVYKPVPHASWWRRLLNWLR